jgi:predicted nucleic acid-binding protein
MTSPIFLDASFWIAYRDARDPQWTKAGKLVQRFFQERRKFVTTIPVFCEIHAHFAKHGPLRKTIIADFWRNPLVQLEPLTETDYVQALTILDKNTDKNYPFCDVLSFVAMRRLRLSQVAAFDQPFHQFGEFQVLD